MTADTDTDTSSTETPPSAENAVAIIYHSETGHTRAIAQNAAAKTDATLIEVRSRHHYCRMGKYLRGGIRAATGQTDAVYPAEITTAPFDIIVVGTPVWSQHPTPVIMGAVAALRGVAPGTKAVVFTTCIAHAGRAAVPLKAALREAGITVQKAYTFPNRHPAGRCGTVLATAVNALKKEPEK